MSDHDASLQKSFEETLCVLEKMENECSDFQSIHESAKAGKSYVAECHSNLEYNQKRLEHEYEMAIRNLESLIAKLEAENSELTSKLSQQVQQTTELSRLEHRGTILKKVLGVRCENTSEDKVLVTHQNAEKPLLVVSDPDNVSQTEMDSLWAQLETIARK